MDAQSIFTFIVYLITQVTGSETSAEWIATGIMLVGAFAVIAKGSEQIGKVLTKLALLTETDRDDALAAKFSLYAAKAGAFLDKAAQFLKHLGGNVKDPN